MRTVKQCSPGPVGPVSSLEEGMTHAADDTIGLAVLDINVIGGTSFPIAEMLRTRGCPFFFITGYGSPALLPDTLHGARRIKKPVDEETLEGVVREQLS